MNLESQFRQVWVSGEISNFVKHSSGHMYMTLKDKSSQIRLVLFAGMNQHLKFDMSNGMEVIVSGSVTVYERSGQYQIIGQYVEPKGVGALQLAFEQLKNKLEKEGLFETQYKQAIPSMPRSIGVITSPTGAAIRDIVQVIRRRYALAHIVISPVRVQGEGATQEIAEAIEKCNEYGELDVLIIGRGGGSLEDLWAFNEELVARAIFASEIPVVSAVGHEIDFTIADFVSDLRVATPSAAAEMVAPNTLVLQEYLKNTRKALVSGIRLCLDDFKATVLMYQKHHVFRDKVNIVRQFSQRVDELSARMMRQINFNIENLKNILQRQSEKISILNPLNILSRGYSVTFDMETGHVMKSISSVKEGCSLKTRVTDGYIYSVIKKVG